MTIQEVTGRIKVFAKELHEAEQLFIILSTIGEKKMKGFTIREVYLNATLTQKETMKKVFKALIATHSSYKPYLQVLSESLNEVLND